MLVGGVSLAWADELTVNETTTMTNQYIPLYGNYADTNGARSEFIIPESQLSEMVGDITQMSFELNATSNFSATYQVYLKIVDDAECKYESYRWYFSGIEGSTVVYQGNLNGSSTTMNVEFNQNGGSYSYTGGNLLVGFLVTTKGSYNSASFKGVSGTNSAIYSTTNNSTTGDKQGFIPKVTFTYTPSGAVSVAKPQNVTASSITATGATIGWDAVTGADSYEISCSDSSTEPDADGTYTSVTTNSYALTGLTGGTTYYVYVRTIADSNHSKWSSVCSFTPGTLTINNVSTTPNNYVPIYGNYMDDHSRSQFIMPKASLSSLSGTQITKIVFYGTADNTAKFANKTFDVYLEEVDDATISSLSDWTSLEKVYSGNLTISDGKMTITLDEGFDYSGDKNLLIGINQTDNDADYTSTTWTGVSASGASLGGYGTSINQQDFLPQTTFYFAPQTASVKKPKNFDDSATTTTTATLGWTNGGDETAWQIAYSTDTDFDPDTEGTKVAVNANPYTLTELTAATTYYAYVRAEKSGEYSAWSNKAEFTTLSATPVIELSTTSHNFGIVSDADAQALTLTISNTGGAALTDLSVTASTGFVVTDAEDNTLTATTIAASSTLTVKVKVNALGQQNGTITINGNEIEEQTVTVSGYMLDDTKIMETFASKPNRWTDDWYSYSATNGAYSGTSAHTLTTPKITVAEGNVLAIRAKYSYSSGYLTIKGSDDNGSTWTAYTKTINYGSDPNLTDDFKLFTLDDVPTTVNKLQLTGEYVYINVFNGFTYANEPVLGIFSNEACTTTQASPATKNFGFATEAQSQLYYIKNTGNGQIDLTIEQADGFTAAVADAALTEGESTALTVTMTATEGLHDGTITVTAKNHDDDSVLGTFVVNANGGITGTKNNVVLTAFPAGWQNNNWTISSGAARIWSSTASDLITTSLSVTEGDKLLVEAYKYYTNSDSQLSYSYSTDNGATWSEAVSLTDQLTTSYKIIAISGVPAGNVLMKFTGTYVYIRQIYGFEAVAEPILTFAAAGTTKNFGMINSATTSDAYTIKNEGTASLDNLSVECDNSNFSITVADNATSIAANGEVTFTVTLNTTATGMQEGVVTISGDNVTTKTFNVKGYVVDGTKEYLTFTSAPARWENSSWSFSASGATAGYNSNATITSPKVNLGTTPSLAISAKLQSNSSSYYVKVEGYDTDSENLGWTYTKTISTSDLNSTDFSVVAISDIPATVNKLRLVGNYVIVNGFAGFTYDDNDPALGVFSDTGFATEITTGSATNSWGFVNENKTATYYIKNTGTGTMTLSKTDAPAGFTATLGETSLGAGESTTLVIAMANDATNNEGYHTGDVVLTAKDNGENTLGTFTVTSSGVVVSTSKTDINFTTLDAFPAGWDGGTYWSVTANTKATISSNSGTLTTGTYKVAAGEKLAIEAKGNSSYSAPTLTYRYTTDNGVNWTTGTSTLTYTYSASDYQIQAITDIPAAAAVKIEFTGKYVDIQRIYGYTAALEPVMTLSPAAASYDFGMQTTAADYAITVTNSGTADMANLAAALTGDDKDDFEVAVSKTTVPYTGENTATVTVTMKASTEYKTHNATLTISADGLADKVIALTGKTRDTSKWYVDFASEIPSSFVETDSWTVSSGYARTTASEENSLTTQSIDLAANEKIYFDAYNPYSGSLKVRYSLNGGLSWSDYTDYTASVNTSGSFSSHEIDLGNADAVTAVVEFTGRYYIQLDNIYGGTLNNTAPMMKVTKGEAIFKNGDTEAFGSIKAEATATYTITNPGNGKLTITDPITKTGEATVTVDKTALTNGESATLTITMPVAAPYEYKEGAVTVETSLGNFVINYNATILNPNALDEQFASDKPAGWYFGGEWTVASNQARNDDGGIADLITEQLHVAGTSDALTFQAKRYSNYSAPTWSVAYSTDRVNWTDVDISGYTLSYSDYTTITVDGLAEGDYYLRIRANRLYVDNFLGWEKKNNTRDLYVTATSIPTTLSANYTATATVTSLIAAEEDVYAKLFFGDTEIATATAADVALRGSHTFTMTAENAPTEGLYKAKIVVYYSDDTVAFTTGTTNVGTLVLDEAETFTAETGTYATVTLNRTFKAGWNSVCLPFAVSGVTTFFGDNASAYAFTAYSEGELTFNKVTTLEAGKPYLVYVETGFDTKELTNVEITATEPVDVTNTVAFKGTYAPVAAGSLEGKYVVSNTDAKIMKATASTTMKGFRAYFENPTGARLSIVLNDDVQGIRTIMAADELAPEGVYNLSGQKVEQLKKGGLYIINGKKVVRK